MSKNVYIEVPEEWGSLTPNEIQGRMGVPVIEPEALPKRSYGFAMVMARVWWLGLVGLYLGLKWAAGYVGWGWLIAGLVVLGFVVYHKWIKGGPPAREKQNCYKCGTRLQEDAELQWWCPKCDGV